jgi:hypothetical protein
MYSCAVTQQMALRSPSFDGGILAFHTVAVRVMLSAATSRLTTALAADLTLDMLCAGYLRMTKMAGSMAGLLSNEVVNYEVNGADKWILAVTKEK